MGLLDRIMKPNWEKSPSYLCLLSKFLVPHAVEDFTKEHQEWGTVLKEDPRKSIKRFIDEGFIERSDINGHLDHEFKLPELKCLLRERGLKITGKKDILIERLIEADALGMKKLVQGTEVFECTEKGRNVSKIYLDEEKKKKEAVEHQVFQALQARDFEVACRLANAYHRQKVFFPGLNTGGTRMDLFDPSHLGLFFSEKPKILGDINTNNLNSLRVAAGMKYLLYVRKAGDWLPKDFQLDSRLDVETAARMISFHSNYLNNLSRFERHGTKEVSIIVADDACEHCQKLKDKKYDLKTVPELPFEKCTSDKGCRCMLVTGMTFEEMIADARR